MDELKCQLGPLQEGAFDLGARHTGQLRSRSYLHGGGASASAEHQLAKQLARDQRIQLHCAPAIAGYMTQ